MHRSAAFILVLASTTFGTAAAQLKQRSLYDRLGGKAAITAVVDEFVARVGGDNRINHFFGATVADTARLRSFKGKLVDQVCQATGGPCQYTGKDMKTAHAAYGITHADFVALVEDLGAALDKFQVAKADKDELVATLAPMEKDIVTR
jgi:hemoglobin